MNKKTRARISASLEEAMKPPGGKEFIPLPKDYNLNRQELTNKLLENYRVKPTKDDELNKGNRSS